MTQVDGRERMRGVGVAAEAAEGERGAVSPIFSITFSNTALSRPFQHLRLCDICNSRRPFRHVVEEEFTDVCVPHRNRFSGDKKGTFLRLFFHERGSQCSMLSSDI